MYMGTRQYDTIDIRVNSLIEIPDYIRKKNNLTFGINRDVYGGIVDLVENKTLNIGVDKHCIYCGSEDKEWDNEWITVMVYYDTDTYYVDFPSMFEYVDGEGNKYQAVTEGPYCFDRCRAEEAVDNFLCWYPSWFKYTKISKEGSVHSLYKKEMLELVPGFRDWLTNCFRESINQGQSPSEYEVHSLMLEVE